MSKRIQTLEGLRVIALCTIVISHMGILFASNASIQSFNYYARYIHWKYFNNPNFGVDYFFMLSGFGLFLNAMNKNKKCILNFRQNIEFAMNRVRKIYPFYCISMLIMLPLMFTDGITTKLILKVTVGTAISTVLLQSLFGVESISHVYNGVCWFLSTLFIIHIFIPYVLKSAIKEKVKDRNASSIKTLKRIIMILLINLLALIAVSFFSLLIERSFLGNKLHIDELFYAAPYVRIFYVIIGVFLGKIYTLMNNTEVPYVNNEMSTPPPPRQSENSSYNYCPVKSKTVSKQGTTEYIMLIINVIYFLYRHSIWTNTIARILLLRFFDVAICCITLYVFSRASVATYIGRFLIFLSKFSQYTVYIFLFHFPIIQYLRYYANKHRITMNDYNFLFFFMIAILMSCFISWFCNWIYTKNQTKRQISYKSN